MPATELLMTTATVPDLDLVLAAWLSGTDYEVRADGPVSIEQDTVWGTAPGSHPRAVVTAAPGTGRGLVRLVAGGGPAPDRPAFEVRGPMAIEFFARDATAVHARLAAGGSFVPITEPIDYDLSSIGSGKVQSVGFRAPGGLVLFVSTMKWVAPPRQLPVSPHFLGPAINMPVVAPDSDRQTSNHFYADLLGMPVRFDGPVQDPDVNRIMGAPAELGYHITVFSIGDGQMAEHHFHADHRLVDAAIAPGHLRSGPVGSSYRVGDFDATLERARAEGIAVRGPVPVAGVPYEGRRVAGLIGPDGELVELVEA